MPLTARQSVLIMRPELMHKLDAASNVIRPMDSTNSIVAALEQTLDSAKEIILADEKSLDNPNEHVVYIDVPSTETVSESEVSAELEAEHGVDLADVQDELIDNGRPNADDKVGLFEVSVHISETQTDDAPSSGDANKRSSLTSPSEHRRHSTWSATVLFLASEVQLIVNLAELSPPDGYEMAPKRVSHV